MTGIGRVVTVKVAVVSHADFTKVKKSGRSGIDKRPVAGPVLLTADGVAGDTICDTMHHGGAEQAVYAYASEDLAFWRAELDRPIPPGGVGENLTLSGVDCNGAVLGERWQIGEAVPQVRAPRIPCQVFAGFLASASNASAVPGLVKRFSAARRPGAYLSVERAGVVQAGDTVTVHDRPSHGVTVVDYMDAYLGNRDKLAAMITAREFLGARGLSWLDRTAAAGRGT